jgi:hypothetical protein
MPGEIRTGNEPAEGVDAVAQLEGFPSGAGHALET